MNTGNYSIRTMTRDELGLAVEWAAREGWNPGLHDADSFYAADPTGFLIGCMDDTPVATISVVRYGESFGFLGFYIVAPEYRGQGYGIRIWNAGLAYLEGRTVGLDGVVAQQENYRKSGFSLAYRNIRYGGKGGGTDPDSDAIVPLAAIPFDDEDRYDRPLFSVARSRFLASWIKQEGSHALGFLGKDGGIAGYGMIRPCRSGWKVGPLFADTAEVAETLFRGLVARVPSDDSVFLDTPEPNRAAIALAERHGMSSVFETARMYTGKAPDIPVERVFGVTSFELG